MIITEENNVSGIDFQEAIDLFPNSLDMDYEDYENWRLEKEISGLLDRCPPSRTYPEKRYRYLLSENFLEVRISPKFRSSLPKKEFNWRYLKDQYYRVCQSLIPLPSFISYLFFIEEYKKKTLSARSSRLGSVSQATHKSRSTFLTLTFDELNFSDWDTNKKRLQSFLKNFTRRGFNQYFWVAEFGTDKARPHFHLVLFNVPYFELSWLQKIWPYGSVWPKECRSFQKLQYYLSVYLSKSKRNWKIPGRGYAISEACKSPIVFHKFPNDFHKKYRLLNHFSTRIFKDFFFHYSLWQKELEPEQLSLFKN